MAITIFLGTIMLGYSIDILGSVITLPIPTIVVCGGRIHGLVYVPPIVPTIKFVSFANE